MSVFHDFQKAWAAKFPGCDLPQAWEEDVRANLAKHRHKVAVLKEELEKEEFYVEYLEQLLADVENHKRISKTKEESDVNSDSSQNGDLRAENSWLDKKCSPSTTCSRMDDEVNATENASPDSLSSETEVNNSPGEANNKGSSYVTVIRVNGYSDKVKANSVESSPESSLKLQEVSSNKSKVPPKPPPKKPRRSTSGTSLNDASSPEAKEQSSTTDSDDKTERGLSSTSLTSSQASLREILEESNDPVITDEKNNEEKMKSESSKNNDASTTENEDSLFITPDKNCDYDTMNSYASGQSGYSSHSGLSDGAVSATSPVDSPKYSDYVNIDYFLRRKAQLKQSTSDVNADDSDDDDGLILAALASDGEDEMTKSNNGPSRDNGTSDDVFDLDSGVYSSSVESASNVPSSSTPPTLSRKKSNSALIHSSTPPPIPEETNDVVASKLEAERIAMYRCIISSILESETVYLECLTVLLQYMKAFRATIGTSQPMMSQEDSNVIFFKIPELQSLHSSFLEGIRNRTQNWDGKLTIGDHFKILASRLGVYAAFLQNYPRAIETVRKCSAENVQFSDVTKEIRLRTLKGQALSLEDLLHKPVARVQKNALVLHDLLKYTPKSHPDHSTLRTALKLTQCFLNEFNSTAAGNLFPAQDRAQRHLVKNSFIVELSEGHRKLRHLFLFNDVLVCAKYKVSGRDKFTFEVKWYIPLAEIALPQEEDSKEIREASPVNILSLKTQASTVRDQILKEEKVTKERQRATGRKQRKKLAELEGQLVLAAPNLAFRIGHKHGRMYLFFLSSDFERMQWVDAINTVQASAPPVSPTLNLTDLQTWITACRTFLKTNMGSFLLRSDDLLVGDLHVAIHSLQGLNSPADVFLSLEVDSYGHFFRKAKTQLSRNCAEPKWDQNFVIELEGSQSLRLLCYEQHPQQGVILRAKTTLELNRQWLNNRVQEKTVTLQELLLTMSIRFVPGEMTLRRAPSAKPCGLFGVKINVVCKKEKRPIPFVITSCAREVERRGMAEIGVYRVSGSTSDVQKLKKAFESNAYEAEQLLKEVDVHSVTGLLKMYLRELPEALFTDDLYPRFFEGFSMPDSDAKKCKLLELFNSLPEVNQSIIIFLIDHMVKLNKQETHNKMSLHNLATVFGPTLLRPGTKSDVSSPSDLLAAETIDVMAQAGILYFFLKRWAMGEPIQIPAKNDTN